MQVIVYLNKGEIIAALAYPLCLPEDVKFGDWYTGEGDTFEEAFKDALDACDWKAELLAGKQSSQLSKTLARIRVHQIPSLDTDDIEYHYELIPAAEWPQDNGQGRLISSDMPEVKARLEIAEDLAYSIPEPGTLLTLYVDTAFGFAGLPFSSNEEIAAEMARHVLLCTRGCKHSKHTRLCL